MSGRQKGAFQREIEDYKKANGMPPDYNLPWEILCALAEDIKNYINEVRHEFYTF